MYDFQNTVLLSARPAPEAIALRFVSLFCAAAALVGCIWINPPAFFFPMCLLFFWWWWTCFHSGIEYEYAYFDGNLDFDKIKDKRKRKSIVSLHMDQVEQIAPAGDPSIESARRNSNMKFMDLSSRKEGHQFYDLIWKEAKEAVCIRFEPDEKFLDSICIKYARKVKK